LKIIPFFRKIEFSENKSYVGGLIIGFFGGLSGNQGALRSAFLIRYKLSKEVFIATGVLIACFIDVTRLSVYYRNSVNLRIEENLPLLVSAVLSVFCWCLFWKQTSEKSYVKLCSEDCFSDDHFYCCTFRNGHSIIPYLLNRPDFSKDLSRKI
jgi:uncharacterized protein